MSDDRSGDDSHQTSSNGSYTFFCIFQSTIPLFIQSFQTISPFLGLGF